MTTPTRADFDPLNPATPDTPRGVEGARAPSHLPTTQTPISFKRRTPSKPTGATAKVGNLLSQLVSGSDDMERDVVPSTFSHRPTSTPNDPRFRAVSESNFSQALDDDEEDEEDDDAPDSADERLARLDWKRKATSGVVPTGRVSFSQGTAPPRLVPPYTRNMASSTKGAGPGDERGGEDEDAPPLVVTPLPKIPMIVLYGSPFPSCGAIRRDRRTDLVALPVVLPSLGNSYRRASRRHSFSCSFPCPFNLPRAPDHSNSSDDSTETVWSSLSVSARTVEANRPCRSGVASSRQRSSCPSFSLPFSGSRSRTNTVGALCFLPLSLVMA